MRLLVISTQFHPDRGGGAAVNTDLCVGLRDLGVEIEVWTTYPHYPEWRDKSGRNGWRIAREEVSGLPVRRFGMFIPSNGGSFWQRVLLEASFLLSLLRGVPAMRHFDVVMAFCPMVSSVVVGGLGSTVWRKPLWLNVQDLAAEAAAAGGMVNGGRLSRLLQAVQRWLFNRASIWSTISPVMVKRLEAMRRHDQRVLHLPNWLNESLATEIDQLGSKLGRPTGQPLRLLYAGNWGRKQNLPALLSALRDCRTPFRFHLHGSGGDEAAVRAWFENHADERFQIGEFLDEPGFARAIHEADLFVMPEIDGSGASFLPSKLMAVLACGTPVICISDADSPLGTAVREADCGQLLSWDRVTKLDEILHAVAVGDAPYEHRQSSAFNYARGCRRDVIIGQFRQALEQQLRSSQAAAG